MKRFLLIPFLMLAFTGTTLAAVSVKVGVIDKDTGAATDEQIVTGVGFTPKFVILYTNANAAVETNEGQGAMSWASGAGEEWGSAWYWEDDVSTTDNNRGYQNTKLIGDISGIGIHAALADITSFDADGFTLSWTTNTAGAVKIAYIAVGGDEIEAEVRNFTMPTGTGNATFAHGLSGGAPTIVFLMSSSFTSVGNQANSNFHFGAAMSSSSRWTISTAAADNETLTTSQDAVKRQSTAKCLQGIFVGAAATDGALDFEADYVSSDATNVTLDFTDAPASAWDFSMLSIRGGNWAIGATNKELDAEPSDQNIATGLSGTTKLLMMAGFGAAATANAVNDAEFHFGASDGSTETALHSIEEGTTLPTQVGSRLTDTKIYRSGSVSSSAIVIENEADFKEFSGGNAVVTWTANDNSIAEQILWATVGEAGAAAVSPISILSRRRR